MAGDTISYVFQAVNSDEVVRAFESHIAAAERSAKSTEGAYRRTGNAAQQAAAKQKAEADKLAAAQQKAADKAAAASQKAAAASQKANEKAEAAKAKASQKWTDARIRTEEKWAKESARAAKKAADDSIREEERKAKAAEQAAKRQAAAAQSVRNAWAAKGASLALGLAAAGAGSAVALVGKASKDVMGTQTAANRVSIAGGRAVDATTLRREAEATAIAHAGQTAEGLLGGTAAFQEARGGDKGKALEEARKYGDVIATVASATGKGADEIGKATALLAKRGDIKSVDEMGNALAMLVEHARQTGQPLEDAVAHLDKLQAGAKRFGLTGVKGAQQLGALQSIATEGAGAGKADQAVEALLTKLKSDKTARALKAQGADPYADKAGHLKDPREILAGLYGKVGSAASASDKLSTISKLVGPKGAAALDPLNKAFAEGYGGAQGSDKEKVQAGVDAMLAAFDKAGEQTGSYADLQKDAGQAETDSMAQLDAAYEKIKAIVGDQLAPKMAELAASLANDPTAISGFIAAIRSATTALSAIVRVAGFFADVSGIKNTVEQANTTLDGVDIVTGKVKDAISSFFGNEPGGAKGPPGLPGDRPPGAVGTLPPAVERPPSAAINVNDLPDVHRGGGGGGGAAHGAGAGLAVGGPDPATALNRAADAITKAADKLGNAKPGGSIYGKPQGGVLDGS